jgi:hypothetical protein
MTVFIFWSKDNVLLDEGTKYCTLRVIPIPEKRYLGLSISSIPSCDSCVPGTQGYRHSIYSFIRSDNLMMLSSIIIILFGSHWYDQLNCYQSNITKPNLSYFLDFIDINVRESADETVRRHEEHQLLAIITKWTQQLLKYHDLLQPHLHQLVLKKYNT